MAARQLSIGHTAARRSSDVVPSIAIKTSSTTLANTYPLMLPQLSVLLGGLFANCGPVPEPDDLKIVQSHLLDLFFVKGL